MSQSVDWKRELSELVESACEDSRSEWKRLYIYEFYFLKYRNELRGSVNTNERRVAGAN